MWWRGNVKTHLLGRVAGGVILSYCYCICSSPTVVAAKRILHGVDENRWIHEPIYLSPFHRLAGLNSTPNENLFGALKDRMNPSEVSRKIWPTNNVMWVTCMGVTNERFVGEINWPPKAGWLRYIFFCKGQTLLTMGTAQKELHCGLFLSQFLVSHHTAEDLNRKMREMYLFDHGKGLIMVLLKQNSYILLIRSCCRWLSTATRPSRLNMRISNTRNMASMYAKGPGNNTIRHVFTP